MEPLIRLGGSVIALVLLGYFIAAMGTEVGTPRAASEPGVAGEFGYQFTMGFAIIVGWAVLSGAEALWKDDAGEPWERFFGAAVPRLLIGIPIFFVVMFIVFAFERVGVGLAGR